ncbi:MULTISPECIES: beta-galactosidase GalB [Flavobacteriaceae]|uniref:beta-galactosidase GalB n=1 Tax=Flavobacteriaceae TaxID=49546 RepID=UPI00149312FD|nr:MULTISPECIES: beta-galactosidase GalB [Allomuricauda]MDC6366197.1 glycoside hydrolase family 2 TIM barrel-domain containing protein [Muricauda sp. AC10]
MAQKIQLKLKSILVVIVVLFIAECGLPPENAEETRERVSINEEWYFMKYDSMEGADSLIYDVRPEVETYNDNIDADTQPTDAVAVEAQKLVLKEWILPTGNAFIKDKLKHYSRPEGNPGINFPFVQQDFNDSLWQKINLPHDWGVQGPFLEGWDAEVGGGMGRLPSHGVAWYRKKLDISKSDKGKSIFLDIDGAMSYAMVWLNGNLVGGWPYGYNSWRVDLTPYLNFGKVNQLAIRLDNPPKSSRWYPGGGIYRNVWLTKTNPVHVAHWGTYVTTTNVSNSEATVNLEITIDNDSQSDQEFELMTKIYPLDKNGIREKNPVANFPEEKTMVAGKGKAVVKGIVTVQNPKLWGPPPTQSPNLYEAVTIIMMNGKVVDEYETQFGIRTLEFNADNGLLVNGELIKFKGVNQHHDLGALGAAFNVRAAERQLEVLKELGCNAIRMAHNPPAPELLELTDRMGFLVIDEVFDVWERKKTPLDFHLIFKDWHEQDLRSFVRRDRNHPSVIMWSFGNEVGEQYTEEEGAALGHRLAKIVKDEDPTRHTTASMNYAKSHMPFPEIMDAISLNYQGEGIRDAPAYKHLKGIKTPPSYPAFHEKFTDKTIISSETAAAMSTRGTYLFPVFDGTSAPSADGAGGDPDTRYVSAYELYSTPFGSSADKVFATQDKNPYVAGEFVWSGWDYLGEPTPYYLSRSSYFGIIDLAGFKKDRFYLYQSRWRPDLPMAHILPHWNWPDRNGKVTPVHVFTSGDEAELFLNGKSLGKKKKEPYTYRLRWDDVVYEPGELTVVVYKDGKQWAEDSTKTTGKASKLFLKADRDTIKANGDDLAFVTLKVVDENGLVVPTASNNIQFSIEGPGEIVATDNGDPTDMVEFPATERKAFSGLALAIIQSKKGLKGTVTVKATSDGLEMGQVTIKCE